MCEIYVSQTIRELRVPELFEAPILFLTNFGKIYYFIFVEKESSASYFGDVSQNVRGLPVPETTPPPFL